MCWFFFFLNKVLYSNKTAAKAHSNSMMSYPWKTPAFCRMLLDFHEKRIRKWFSSWATSIYILRRFINDARNKRNKSLSLPWLSTGSSNQVNGACIGSIGLSVLFLFQLVWTEMSGNGNQPGLRTPKGIVCRESCSGPSPLVISILPFSNFSTPTSQWLLLWTIFTIQKFLLWEVASDYSQRIHNTRCFPYLLPSPHLHCNLCKCPELSHSFWVLLSNF